MTLTQAVAEVESGNNTQAVGKHGERGAYQMKEAAWKDAGLRLKEKWHYCYAHDKGISARHAEAYLAILSEGLTKLIGRKPTNQEIYAAYRLGLGGFRRYGSYANLPASIRESCERVNNLTK